MSKTRKIIKFLIALLLCQGAGIIGSLFTVPAIDSWYQGLEKPIFNPPGWVFGPAWALLYFLMAVSVYLIWRRLKKDKKAKEAFWLFWIHLVFNASWTIVFFGLRNPGLALVNIAFIWLFIIVLIVRFYKISKTASYLLWPYLLWVSFASVLNYFIWHLN